MNNRHNLGMRPRGIGWIYPVIGTDQKLKGLIDEGHGRLNQKFEIEARQV
jgi:hypothetical protein